MDGYSRQEVAGKAGVDVGYVDRLVEQAILKPGTEGTASPHAPARRYQSGRASSEGCASAQAAEGHDFA